MVETCRKGFLKDIVVEALNKFVEKKG